MEDPLLLSLIVVHADNFLLEKLSRTPLWRLLSIILQDMHFWYLRTEAAFVLPTIMQWDHENNKNENWRQVYNILSSSRFYNPFRDCSTSSSKPLQENGCNFLAIKWLLNASFDPSVDESYSLRIAAEYGSPQALELLLNDKRVDPCIEDAEGWSWVLSRAAAGERIENMKILLLDQRMLANKSKNIEAALCTAAEDDKVSSLEFLLQQIELSSGKLEWLAYRATENESVSAVTYLLDQYPIFQDEEVRSLLVQEAIEHSLEVLQLLHRRKMVTASTPQEAENYVQYAMMYDRVDTISFLLQNLDFKPTSKKLLELASDGGDGEVMKKVLSDAPELDRRSIVLAIQRAVVLGRSEALRVLLDDPRTRDIDCLLVGLLRDAEQDPDVTDVLVRARQLNLDEVLHSTLIDAIGRLGDYLQPSILHSSKLSGVPKREIERMIEAEYDNPEEHYFELLLREIVVKRSDAYYYVQWMKERDTLDRTAMPYSGFLALLLASDREATLRELEESEKGNEKLIHMKMLLGGIPSRLESEGDELSSSSH